MLESDIITNNENVRTRMRTRMWEHSENYVLIKCVYINSAIFCGTE